MLDNHHDDSRSDGCPDGRPDARTDGHTDRFSDGYGNLDHHDSRRPDGHTYGHIDHHDHGYNNSCTDHDYRNGNDSRAVRRLDGRTDHGLFVYHNGRRDCPNHDNYDRRPDGRSN